VPRKTFFITIVAKAFNLTFYNFSMGKVLDLERRTGRRRIGGTGMGNKGWFFYLSIDHLL
jgi:hypothetical protein